MNTVDDVRAWLASLEANGRLFHMDDSPDSICWDRPIDAYELTAIEVGREHALNICEASGVDIFDLYPSAWMGEHWDTACCEQVTDITLFGSRFTLTSTGGGCVGLICSAPDGSHVLITGYNEDYPPTRTDYSIGAYDADGACVWSSWTEG